MSGLRAGRTRVARCWKFVVDPMSGFWKVAGGLVALAPPLTGARDAAQAGNDVVHGPRFAPAAVPALVDFVDYHKGDLLLRTDTLPAEEKARLPPIYELAWNHTTLRGLKVDPSITYLQTQYPDLEHVKKIISIFGDELPMHIEMNRFDGRIVFSGLPIVRYSSEERLEEIIRIHEENGCLVFNPHRYTLEEGGMKRTDRGQLAFKKEADPKGLLNPGKMIAWDDPDFDFESGRVWLFAGLQTLGAA